MGLSWQIDFSLLISHHFPSLSLRKNIPVKHPVFFRDWSFCLCILMNGNYKSVSINLKMRAFSHQRSHAKIVAANRKALKAAIYLFSTSLYKIVPFISFINCSDCCSS